MGRGSDKSFSKLYHPIIFNLTERIALQMKGKTLVMFHNPPAITADDIAESNIKVNQIEACCVNMTPPAWISPNTGSLQSQNTELKVVFAIALMIFHM